MFRATLVVTLTFLVVSCSMTDSDAARILNSQYGKEDSVDSGSLLNPNPKCYVYGTAKADQDGSCDGRSSVELEQWKVRPEVDGQSSLELEQWKVPSQVFCNGRGDDPKEEAGCTIRY